MDKASSATAPPAAPDAADAHAQSPEEAAPPLIAARLLRACGQCLRFAAAGLAGYSFAATAWRVRHDPRDLAFIAAAGLLLAALLACLRRAERLTPDSPAGERRRVHATVSFLSTVLSCAFAYRVAAVMPPAVAVVVCCMTAFVVIAGFCLLVLCKDQQYEALDDADYYAGDTKAYVKIICPADELV